MQIHDLRPHIEGHGQLQPSLRFRLEPPPAAFADIFAAGVFGRWFGWCCGSGRDGVGAGCGARLEEVFGGAVGDVGLGRAAEGFGVAERADEACLGFGGGRLFCLGGGFGRFEWCRIVGGAADAGGEGFGGCCWKEARGLLVVELALCLGAEAAKAGRAYRWCRHGGEGSAM